jgi:hypothetical protein
MQASVSEQATRSLARKRREEEEGDSVRRETGRLCDEYLGARGARDI